MQATRTFVCRRPVHRSNAIARITNDRSPRERGDRTECNQHNIGMCIVSKFTFISRVRVLEPLGTSY